MKLEKIIRIADKAYNDDECVLRAYQAETGSVDEMMVGDSLAVFVARELKETYDEDAGREAQIDETYRVISVAHEQLENVLNALAIANTKRPSLMSAANRVPRVTDLRTHEARTKRCQSSLQSDIDTLRTIAKGLSGA